MYSAVVQTLMATNTLWMDHKVGPMGQNMQKNGLYSQYVKNIIATTGNTQDHLTLQGKFIKIIGAAVLQHYSLFTYVLGEAKHFSFITQKQNIS